LNIMKATAVIFTYPKDYEAAGIAARALRNCGVRVVMAIDGKDPAIHIDGAEQVVRTHFPRKGNLNGIDCMLGIIDTLAGQVREDDEWVLKVDSDTVVHSMKWLEDMPDGKGLVGTGHDPAKNDGRTLYGCCYAVRPQAMEALRAQVIQTGSRPTRAEDLMMGNAGEALGLLHRYVLHRGGHMGPWVAKLTVEEMMANYQVICVQRTGKHATSRQEVMEKMARIYATKWP
jgi:hypothetical protein